MNPERKVTLKMYKRNTALLGAVLFFAACGTTYSIPEISETHDQQATKMFAEEASKSTSTSSSDSAAVARFNRVVSRMEPLAESFCRNELASKRPDINCDVHVFIDREMPARNAYQTHTKSGDPVIGITLPLLKDSRNDDEIAFVLGHEYGHLVARHIEKAEQQAMAGAILMGTAMAASQAYASTHNPYRYTGNDYIDMQNAMDAGSAVGQRAYSQTYELESDVIATHLTRAAGYDPVLGARYFARPEEARSETGKLSFWGTHPPDQKRLALVLQTNSNIANRATKAAD